MPCGRQFDGIVLVQHERLDCIDAEGTVVCCPGAHIALNEGYCSASSDEPWAMQSFLEEGED